MAKVTIPTASYVGRDPENTNNQLLPHLLPSNADFNQQCKLWRFYCTCLDLGCSGYRLEDFEGKNMSQKDKYLHWVRDWKMHYDDISRLTRLYKSARSRKWFNYHEDYRKKLSQHCITKYKLNSGLQISEPSLWEEHCSIINDKLDKLRQSAQHLLNARFIGKLAAGSLRTRNNGIIA